MKTFILISVCLLIGFLAGKSKSRSNYETVYQAGFDKGLDTASVLYDQEFDSLLTKMKADQKLVEDALINLNARQIESFLNHSEIKP